MTRNDIFMAFWKSLNDFAESRELPPVLYGEAKDLFEGSDLSFLARVAESSTKRRA